MILRKGIILLKETKALSTYVAVLWIITLVWTVFDLNYILVPPMNSEAQVWFLALSGIFILFMLASAIVAIWPLILCIATCLLLANLIFERYDRTRKYRWIGAVIVTGALVPTLVSLNVVRIVPFLQPIEKAVEAHAAALQANVAQRNAGQPDRSFAGENRSVSTRSEQSSRRLAETIARMERAARARCATATDPETIDACERAAKDLEWSKGAEGAR